MKYIGLAFLALVLVGCAPASIEEANANNQQRVLSLLPEDVILGKSIGEDWWSGTYHEKKVLVHLVYGSAHINVDIIFTGETE
jgi:PBP1b-binding outer membrane lipoprotein LpoB